MNQSDEIKLKQLNQATFDAEWNETVGGQRWDEFLRQVLAESFTIRRSNPAVPNQDREAMIAWIDSHERVTRTVDNVTVYGDDLYGIATSRVILSNSSDEFQNLKVFKQEPSGNWRCYYWQVTKV